MNVFGIGLPEMVLILVVALLVFGPKKLPEIGRSLGKALKGFQDASKEFENEFKRQAEMIENPPQPLEATLEALETETTPADSSPKQLSQSETIEVATEAVAEAEGVTTPAEAEDTSPKEAVS
jgi:sec-independent protein translocase protein TatA